MNEEIKNFYLAKRVSDGTIVVSFSTVSESIDSVMVLIRFSFIFMNGEQARVIHRDLHNFGITNDSIHSRESAKNYWNTLVNEKFTRFLSNPNHDEPTNDRMSIFLDSMLKGISDHDMRKIAGGIDNWIRNRENINENISTSYALEA
jgi:hypothetical protein